MKAKEVFPGVFSRHAAAYRERVGAADGGIPLARREALARISPRPGDRVLDLACGPGTLTLPIAEAVGPGGRVVAVDLADGMLELLREVAPPNVDVRRMDIERLEFPDQVFDAVICGHGYQFVPDLPTALREAWRVLRPGGRFAASIPETGASTDIRDLIEGTLQGLLPPAPAVTDRTETIAVLRDAERLAAALSAAGFTTVEVTQHEEASEYPDAEAVTDRTFSWWDCAWRMEQLDPPARAAVRRHYLETVRSLVTEWPMRVTNATGVASGVRPR